MMLFGGRRFGLENNTDSMMSADIRECDVGYTIDMNVPGYAKEDLSIQLEKGYMTVRANKNTENSTKSDQGKIVRQERYYGSCSRSFYVGDKITEEDIKARYQNGVLTVNIPKKEAVQEDTKKFISID